MAVLITLVVVWVWKVHDDRKRVIEQQEERDRKLREQLGEEEYRRAREKVRGRED